MKKFKLNENATPEEALEAAVNYVTDHIQDIYYGISQMETFIKNECFEDCPEAQQYMRKIIMPFYAGMATWLGKFAFRLARKRKLLVKLQNKYQNKK